MAKSKRDVSDTSAVSVGQEVGTYVTETFIFLAISPATSMSNPQYVPVSGSL